MSQHQSEASNTPVIISICKWLSHLAGALGLLAAMWCAMLTGFNIGPNIYVILYLDGYKPAEYTVTRINFSKGSIRGNRSYGGYYAEGLVDGNMENFKLGDYVPGVVNSKEDITRHVQVGNKLKVMYNPNVPKWDKRVLYPEKDFYDYWQVFQKKMIRIAYGPFALLMLLSIFFGIFGKVLKKSLGLLIGSLFIILFAWFPVIFEILF